LCPASDPQGVIAATDEIGEAKFSIGVDGCPRPNVSPSGQLLLWRSVLLFATDKTPNLIALQTANPNITHMCIVIADASASKVTKHLGDSILACASHASDRTDGNTLDHHCRYLRLFPYA
jgi:hypothetical protein